LSQKEIDTSGMLIGGMIIMLIIIIVWVMRFINMRRICLGDVVQYDNPLLAPKDETDRHSTSIEYDHLSIDTCFSENYLTPKTTHGVFRADRTHNNNHTSDQSRIFEEV
jgi:hypothetical protein